MPHLGNVVGCVLPGDVYSRFLKLDGEECRYICGTDNNGTPITISAQKHGESPEEWSEKCHEELKDLFEGLNLNFDVYSKTTKQNHAEKTIEIYEKLKENDYIYKKDIEILYCTQCEKSLPDRFVEGKCPECGAEDARGDQCDECGAMFDSPSELVDYQCATCGSRPEKRESEHVFFKLSALEDEIRDLLDRKRDQWSKTAVNLTENLLKEGLKDKDISRNMNWGINIPDHPEQVFYVWFDAPIGYISFSEEIGVGEWWKDEETKLTQFMGKDNVPFHSVYFPAILKGTRDGYIEPERITATQFLTYEGGAFSKSRGRGVFLDDALELYPGDYWRYILMKMNPKDRDREFSWDEFRKIVNHDLNDVIGNLVHRTLTLTEKYFDGEIPDPELMERDQEILENIDKTVEEVREHMHETSFSKALNSITELSRDTNKYITDEEPWKNEERRKEVIYTSLQIVKALSILLEPFIPESADKIKGFLGVDPKRLKECSVKLEPEHKINDFKPLFKKISKEEAEKHEEKFKDSEQEKEEEKMDKIPFDRFKEIEMKTGQIKEVEEVEGADKLYKVRIDIGKEERTTVAGLKEYYDSEELEGKKVVVATNLEPAEIMGIKSEAMVLAAVEGDEVALLRPDKEIGLGTSVE